MHQDKIATKTEVVDPNATQEEGHLVISSNFDQELAQVRATLAAAKPDLEFRQAVRILRTLHG